MIRNAFPKSTAGIIRKLRAERNLFQTELAKRAGMSAAQLCKVERGQHELTTSTLRRIADALDVPVSVLLGEGVSTSDQSVADAASGDKLHDEMDEGHYKLVLSSVDGDVSALREIADFEKRLAAAEERLGVAGQSDIRFAYSYSADERAAELLARDVRSSLGMGSQPRVDVAVVLENAGVRIVKVRRPAVFKSVSFYNCARRTFSIALNASNTRERGMYRLAYELGAMVRFVSNGYATIADEGSGHRFLRSFAAAFLMPEEAVRSIAARLGVAPGGWTMPVLVWTKERFGVSVEAFALRLESLGLIAPALRIALRDELHKRYETHPRSKEPHPPKNQSRLDILKAIESDFDRAVRELSRRPDSDPPPSTTDHKGGNAK